MSDQSRKSKRAKTVRRPSAAAASASDNEETKRPLESESYVLRLYVTGTTPASSRAIQNVRRICEDHLQGRYELEVIDIYQSPALAKYEQIIATPTLVKLLPAPLRRYIGDLTKAENILFRIDLREKK